MLGLVGTFTIGPIVHVLLVVALVLFVVRLLSGRRSLAQSNPHRAIKTAPIASEQWADRPFNVDTYFDAGRFQMDLRQLMNPRPMALAVAVILTVAALAWLYVQKRRRSTRAEMRQRFGPEYERTVGEQGSERRADTQLAAREKRVEQLKIHDLDPAKRELFAGQWHVLQSRFVDDPKGAITEADALVSTVMQARGYPVADFNQRAADISVDHPRVVANYRSAHEIALRLGKGEANTEDLRTAMIHYRSLFDELVQVPTAVEIKEVA